MRTIKFFMMISIVISILSHDISFAADIQELEREANILRVEFNRIGSSGDPFEREMILQKIIDRCKGTEEAVNAYWDLSDLYLEGFQTEKRQEAREMLELCLKNYPASPRAAMIKCRLIDLYDNGDSRRAELVRQLQNDKTLPNVVRSSIK